MNSTIAKRIGSLAVIVAGLLSAVLAPAGGNTASWRWFGLFLIVLGVYFLLGQKASPEQRTAEAQKRKDNPPLRWYQSPILWVPVVAAILAILSMLVV
ncbi:hypothetical protein [Pseudidiomarina terrestris]|uniref:Uncharacterized protein n=1 Tax=Pseudidiomarina terrestris TaxID=2820060 RepID=A0AAW7QV35_9GAMM|nr:MULTISPECIES: hypothetical protein [unclassified Pseudidiomarina]MDN7124076.1 hypothetical protein [Pseudidiomarina sp. 1APP75-32.1]MDN7127148.1 hypothetical protein [Pseudidiomarina sp. 1APR75-33.1]MDN7128333.1 hypothetical protein [Pseudidiomarina sp. 1APR75-15]MDN7135439.1 hypothetical protein [Pseudidiomarina sp. 1ASP75-5]MDN7138529.1 hypothetical protein [Pseudidiomarina sp. 1ASP75-14]